MAHAPMQIELPELPDAIKSRLVPYRADDIQNGLRALEYWHPGLFTAMQRVIDLLEADGNINLVSVDFDEDDVLYPTTIWAESTFPLDERLSRVAALENQSDDILSRFPDVVLVAIL